ncbi:hypothetical protein IKG02_01235 [Candidatus Saccharibacteria bacterium]|nr:hypothetical protein [Candidatus Saccharibacteria bacterium]
MDKTKTNNKKEKVYGLKSLIFFGLSLLCFRIFSFTLEINETLSAVLFYASLILEVLSFIFGLIGLKKDKNKTFSIIGTAVFVVIILLIILYINIILPKVVKNAVDAWSSSWGIK